VKPKYYLLLAICGISAVLAGNYFSRPKPLLSSDESSSKSPITLNASDAHSNLGNQSAQGMSSAPKVDSTAGEASVASLPEAEQKKITILNEILLSKNDNDLRMDTELRDFTPAAKRVLEKRYSGTAPEKRNERGTYVFLMGREIKDGADVEFFKSVLMEKPCLSLENCDRAPEGQSGEEEHLGAINETTSNYPQLVAIRALLHKAQELMEAGKESDPLFASLLQTIREIRVSPNPRVVEEANRALKELKRD